MRMKKFRRSWGAPHHVVDEPANVTLVTKFCVEVKTSVHVISEDFVRTAASLLTTSNGLQRSHWRGIAD